jgi:prolipoprotein diacylglyceryltransferase
MNDVYLAIGAIIWYGACELWMERNHRRDNMTNKNFWIRNAQILGALAMAVGALVLAIT